MAYIFVFVSMRNSFCLVGWSNIRMRKRVKNNNTTTHTVPITFAFSAPSPPLPTSIFHFSIIDRHFWYIWFFNKLIFIASETTSFILEMHLLHTMHLQLLYLSLSLEWFTLANSSWKFNRKCANDECELNILNPTNKQGQDEIIRNKTLFFFCYCWKWAINEM